MTEQNAKLRALGLAGLMVLSVFAATVAFGGSAVAFTHDRGATGTWDTTDGEGNVGDGAVVFQGEGDITFIDGGGSEVPAQSLTNNDGVALGMPIPDDRAEGTYDGGGISVTLANPQITDYEFRTTNGADIAGGTVSGGSNSLSVWAEYNFAEAEDLEIEVTDSNDNDWTDEVTTTDTKSGLASTPNDEVEFDLDLSSLDADEEYTVTLTGSDDLDSGDAQVSDTFEISTAPDPTLSLDDDEITQGQDASYEVTGAVEGDYHVVTISTNDVISNAGDIFRNVNDVEEADATGDYAYAVVEIDGGTGEGLIDTQHLDTTDVTVQLHNTTDPDSVSIRDVLDEQDLSVEEGTVTLDNPTDRYVYGSDATVNGTASEGIDEVTLYARDQAEYQRVQIGSSNTMSVSGGEFEVEDVDLSQSEAQQGNNILAYEGNYRIALVAGDPGPTMTTTNVAQNVSDTHTLRVEGGEFSINTSIVNGELAVGDSFDVWGEAPGGDEINVSFIGPRGTFDQYAGIDIESDGTFHEEDVVVGGNTRQQFVNTVTERLNELGIPNARSKADQSFAEDFSDLSKGRVVMSVGHKGRDGVMGDGQDPDVQEDIMVVLNPAVPKQPIPRSGLPALIYRFNTGSYTQGQLSETLFRQSSGDTGSDDVSTIINFRLTDPRTTVDNAVGEAGVNGTVQIGSDLTVQGTTNRQPGDNTITVEVIEGPSQTDFDVATTDEWGTDGRWNATLDTEGLQPGSYTVEATDGTTSDVHQFQLTEDEAGLGEDESTPTATSTPSESTDTPANATATPANATDTPANGTDGQDGPGFTFVAAIVGLLAAALLAARRHS